MEIKIKVVKFPVGSDPLVVELGNDLDSMQAEVEGSIQIIEVRLGGVTFDLVCNEEGLLNGMKYNRTVRYHDIYGPFFLCHNDPEDGNTTSVTDSDIKMLVGGAV